MVKMIPRSRNCRTARIARSVSWFPGSGSFALRVPEISLDNRNLLRTTCLSSTFSAPLGFRGSTCRFHDVVCQHNDSRDQLHDLEVSHGTLGVDTTLTICFSGADPPIQRKRGGSYADGSPRRGLGVESLETRLVPASPDLIGYDARPGNPNAYFHVEEISPFLGRC